MDVVIYTRNSYCGWCNKAKEALSDAGFEYTEIIVGDQIARDDFVHMFWRDVLDARPTVPQITINGDWIGGYEDLKVWLEKNKDVNHEPASYE